MRRLDELIAKGIITENRDSMSLAYILRDPQLFSLTGYKVLKSQEEQGFVHCSKILHNGRDKFVYNISSYKPLSVLMPGLRPDIMLAIVRNLTEVVIAVKNNGFMQCDNVSVDLDKIFVNTNNYKVFLIYVPISTESSGDSYAAFEYQLKENIIKEISLYPNLAVSPVMKLCDGMRDSTVTVEGLKELIDGLSVGTPDHVNSERDYSLSGQHMSTAGYGQDKRTQDCSSMASYINRTIQDREQESIRPAGIGGQQGYSESSGMLSETLPAEKKGIFGRIFKSDKTGKRQPEGKNQSYHKEDYTEIMDQAQEYGGLTLVGVNTPEYCEIAVLGESFVIGKNAEKADYVVTFNRAVSREHCRLARRAGQWYVEDLNSSNGTFLNKTRLKPGQPVMIKAGDRLRLANSDFTVKQTGI